jgi:hypothetical protein
MCACSLIPSLLRATPSIPKHIIIMLQFLSYSFPHVWGLVCYVTGAAIQFTGGPFWQAVLLLAAGAILTHINNDNSEANGLTQKEESGGSEATGPAYTERGLSDWTDEDWHEAYQDI